MPACSTYVHHVLTGGTKLIITFKCYSMHVTTLFAIFKDNAGHVISYNLEMPTCYNFVRHVLTGDAKHVITF